MTDLAFQHWRTHVVIVGSGVAGLACALALAPTPVTLITKTARPQGGSSFWAKGGIAAALGPDDTPEEHAADTVAAGAGLTDRRVALLLAREGAALVGHFAEAGLPFDRTPEGELALGREAAHGRHRIVHAGGDAIGRNLVKGLLGLVEATPSVRILTDCVAIDIVRQNGIASGLIAHQRHLGWLHVHARCLILATGGIGALWRETTNPAECTGDGLALAARAGATLADLEFVQFHPTALKLPERRPGEALPLLTEALRGAGARLLTGSGQRFMAAEHPLAELAPRDVVARAIAARTQGGEAVFLDLRPALAKRGVDAFPEAVALCRAAGFDPERAPVPIVPAAHYHMGGIVTDADGRTDVPGLWACGEVACTGVHGANRLASNSLLEGLVFGRRVARDINRRAGDPGGAPSLPRREMADVMAAAGRADAIRDEVQALMSRHLGIVRHGNGMREAQARLAALDALLARPGVPVPPSSPATDDFTAIRAGSEARNMVRVARLITTAALARTESRGAHFRGDYPTANPAWRRHQEITSAALAEDEGAPKRLAGAQP